MPKVADTHSLGDFQRNAREHVRELKRTGRPTILTVNGRPEAVVQSTAAYKRLVADRELLDHIKSLSRGLDQSYRREGRPMRAFIAELAAKNRISLK